MSISPSPYPIFDRLDTYENRKNKILDQIPIDKDHDGLLFLLRTMFYDFEQNSDTYTFRASIFGIESLRDNAVRALEEKINVNNWPIFTHAFEMFSSCVMVGGSVMNFGKSSPKSDAPGTNEVRVNIYDRTQLWGAITQLNELDSIRRCIVKTYKISKNKLDKGKDRGTALCRVQFEPLDEFGYFGKITVFNRKGERVTLQSCDFLSLWAVYYLDHNIRRFRYMLRTSKGEIILEG